MKKLLVIAIVAALASVTFAQRGGMFMRRGGGLLQLAMRDDVAKEINLTDAEKTKLEDLQQEQRQAMRDARQSMGDNPDPDEMRKMMDDMQAKQKAALAGILDANQMQRLQELSYQRQGAMAILDKETATKLGVTADQQSKIDDLSKKYQSDVGDIMMQVRNDQMDQSEAGPKVRSLTDKFKSDLAAILTADQNKKLTDMGGKPFTFDASLDQGRPGGS